MTRVKYYYCKTSFDGGEQKREFVMHHFDEDVDLTNDGVPLENAIAKIQEWNDITKSQQYRINVPEIPEPELPDIPEMESPMTFKTFMKRQIKGFGVRSATDMVCAFNQWHFDVAGIPTDDDGMDAEHALYMVNKFNKESTDYKFWLDIEG